MQIQLYAYKKLTLNMKTQKIGKYMHDEHYLKHILSNYIIICQFFKRKQSQTFIYLRTELQNAYHENYFLRIGGHYPHYNEISTYLNNWWNK